MQPWRWQHLEVWCLQKKPSWRLVNFRTIQTWSECSGCQFAFFLCLSLNTDIQLAAALFTGRSDGVCCGCGSPPKTSHRQICCLGPFNSWRLGASLWSCLWKSYGFLQVGGFESGPKNICFPIKDTVISSENWMILILVPHCGTPSSGSHEWSWSGLLSLLEGHFLAEILAMVGCYKLLIAWPGMAWSAAGTVQCSLAGICEFIQATSEVNESRDSPRLADRCPKEGWHSRLQQERRGFAVDQFLSQVYK